LGAPVAPICLRNAVELAPAAKTVNVWLTGSAGAKVLFPACDARIETVPAPVSVTRLPLTVAGPEKTV